MINPIADKKFEVYKAKEKKFIDDLNRKFASDIEKICEKEGRISKLGDLLKYAGLEKIDLRYGDDNYIFKNPSYFNVYLDDILKSVYNLPKDYPEKIKKFYQNTDLRGYDNPHRIEVSLERSEDYNSKPGTIACVFGSWVKTPYWKGTNSIDCYDGPLGFNMDSSEWPKNALVVFRPDKMLENKKILDFLYWGEFRDREDQLLLDEPTHYRPTQIRISNDVCYDEGQLIISKYLGSIFETTYIDEQRDTVIEKWDFLIPGLKECYDFQDNNSF